MGTLKINKVFSLLIALFIASASLYVQSTWKVDNAHAKLTFSTLHNTISDVEGMFNFF